MNRLPAWCTAHSISTRPMPDIEDSEMEDKAPVSDPVHHDDAQELVYRPWVLWTGVGLCGALSLGLLVFTYFHSFDKGYQLGLQEGDAQGFNRAISCNMVQENLNAAAEQNVLGVMRLYSTSDEQLRQTAAELDKAFGWMKNAEVRQEAEWNLADALLQRSMGEAALKVLEPLGARVPHSAEWAYRMLRAADLLAAQQNVAGAEKCYRLAAVFFAENQMQPERLCALGNMVALELAAPRSMADAQKAWKALYAELKGMGDETKPLRSLLLVHMAEQYRTRESRAAAEKMYRAALEGTAPAQENRPEYAAAYGTALLELGDVTAAEPLLRRAAEHMGNRPVQVAARLLALRQLAAIEQGRGQNALAVSLLQRVQGVAEGRVPPTNTFWPCLFDQRGWLQYLALNYQAALQDFSAALASTQEPLLQVQPMEGAARCHLELAQWDEAQPLLEKCLEMRTKHIPADKSSIGRLNLLLGQLYDQQGKAAEAEAAYGAAVTNLTADTPAEVDNRRMAMLGRAYALSELRRWQEAYATWEQLLPLLEDQHDRREEARNQMRRIKPYLPGETNTDDASDTPSINPEN